MRIASWVFTCGIGAGAFMAGKYSQPAPPPPCQQQEVDLKECMRGFGLALKAADLCLRNQSPRFTEINEL